jgi:chromate transporter
MELNAFCNLLPGPTSTQIITAIGYNRGKLLLAILTLLVWILPSSMFFTILVLVFNSSKEYLVNLNALKFLQPMALGFLIYSAYKMIKNVINTGNAIVIAIIALIITAFFQSPFTFPIIFLISVVIANFRHDDLPPHQFKLKLKWGNIIAFFSIALVIAIVGAITKNSSAAIHRPFVIFENFYRFGALTFGGGQLLVPVMYEQFVLHRSYISSQEYLSGVGLVQALPGPVYSIATYTGGMIMGDLGWKFQILGAVIGMIGIFLPGFLLMIFLFPVWVELRKYPFIKRGLSGINAATVGFILAASYIMIKDISLTNLNIFVMVGTFLILLFEIVPPPFIAIVCLVAGFIF